MTFEWALSALKDGKRVTRKSWYESWSRFQNFFYLENNWLKSLYSHTLKWDDFTAQDWEEYILMKDRKPSVENEVMGEPV